MKNLKTYFLSTIIVIVVICLSYIIGGYLFESFNNPMYTQIPPTYIGLVLLTLFVLLIYLLGEMIKNNFKR